METNLQRGLNYCRKWHSKSVNPMLKNTIYEEKLFLDYNIKNLFRDSFDIGNAEAALAPAEHISDMSQRCHLCPLTGSQSIRIVGNGLACMGKNV